MDHVHYGVAGYHRLLRVGSVLIRLFVRPL
jgi:hypothetical protein